MELIKGLIKIKRSFEYFNFKKSLFCMFVEKDVIMSIDDYCNE